MKKAAAWRYTPAPFSFVSLANSSSFVRSNGFRLLTLARWGYCSLCSQKLPIVLFGSTPQSSGTQRETSFGSYARLDRISSFPARSLVVVTFQNLGNATHCGTGFQCIDRRLAAYASDCNDMDGLGIYAQDFITATDPDIRILSSADL
jgi:hypothetical protein